MYDFVITNGLIVDGTRRKPFKGNLFVEGGKIAKIVPAESAEAADAAAAGAAGEAAAGAAGAACEVAAGAAHEAAAGATCEAAAVFDAQGHVVAPGFINLHTHSDYSYLATSTYESMLDGGVTLEVCGQCGLSCIPFQGSTPPLPIGGLLKVPPEKLTNLPHNMTEYAQAIEETGVSINVGMMIGHGALRTAIVGLEERPLTASELREMCELLDRELKAGALGVTFGLIYPPGSFCDIEEIKALARICAANDKVLAVHVRNENRYVFEAVDEMLAMAKETGVRLEISHLKLMGKTMWGRADELLARIDMARAKGVSVHCDQYPYEASSSGLFTTFPKDALDGGLYEFSQNLKDDAFWNRISANGTLPELEFRGGVENIVVCEIGGPDWPELVGKSLTQIADMLGTSVGEAVRQILIRCEGNINCVYHNMSMEDVLTIASQRDVSVISDGTAFDLSDYGGCPHPRSCGSIPRFFRFVREYGLMPIEDAVYKVSGLPTTVLGTDDRFGFLRAGLDATITVFDQERITDHATYEQPNLKSEGIDYVFVNGQLVLDHGTITDARPGKCILR